MKIVSSKEKDRVAPLMTALELAQLGEGEVGYIKTLSTDEATRMFPEVDNLPKGIPLFSLHGADGTPIALTDTLGAAMDHAQEDDLEIATLH